MFEPACLYALIESPRERHDAILACGVEPLAARWRDDPNLDSLFFVRYSEPVWQVRFRVLGEPGWIDRVARPACQAAFEPLLAEGVAGTLKFAVYDRELERYGGERGMRLAERMFHLDSLAVLDWLALERAGGTRWSRREFALAMAESFADGFGFDPTGRREFYRQGYQWAFDLGTWGESERAVLEERFERNRSGLEALLAADPPRTGSPAEHALMAGFENDSVPTFAALRTGLANGSVRAHAPHLAWSLAHMFTNRLGIEPAAEAILRFMAGRRFELALGAGESEPAAGARARE